MFKSNRNPQFRSKFSEDIFYTKYSHEGAETFHELACTLVEDVCQTYLSKDEKEALIDHISNLRFFIHSQAIFTMQDPRIYIKDFENPLQTTQKWGFMIIL